MTNEFPDNIGAVVALVARSKNNNTEYEDKLNNEVMDASKTSKENVKYHITRDLSPRGHYITQNTPHQQYLH